MKHILLLFALFMVVLEETDAQPVSPQLLNLHDGIALDGYDAVAYQQQNRAVKGDGSIKLSYNGATYYFSSTGNLELFRKSPQQYLPAYGGWCAYAMGKSGDKVPVDPETFKIINGKLYLFYNKFFNNTLVSWNKDESRLKAQAERNWTSIINKKSKL
ncbi:YHS domain-containing protein [Flavihumibacter rivuli]|uniref:YHS domain-containing (seleno)protein n=1 Tax=Flavihumibacter rivuli TaxID=2838156 RepID=UPI001BDF1471|nr:YHS domain-containing (seleno)protein [Flavihumibacter rivuli]ULQ57866.1 YHS domain-containing protein [Flavihumibacter rivuli]